MTVDSGGSFLYSGADPTIDNFDRAALGSALDGRVWSPVVGAWSANGSKLTTSTVRTSDPRILIQREFSDFEISGDMGPGDALYFRFADGANWLRLTYHRDYSTSSFACNPYACNAYACNAYACNGYICGYYSCNCGDSYYTAENMDNITDCVSSMGHYGFSWYHDSCGFCRGQGGMPTCESHDSFYWQETNYRCLSNSPTEYCTAYGGYSCQSCASYCFETCYETCYQTCYQTCYNYHYPNTLRLEKFVGSALTTVQSVQINDANEAGRNVRVRGAGTNIQVFHGGSTTAVMNQTVAENRFARGYGVGRVGYGNTDSTFLDNFSLKTI